MRNQRRRDLRAGRKIQYGRSVQDVWKINLYNGKFILVLAYFLGLR
jgi:hypothetical protein